MAISGIILGKIAKNRTKINDKPDKRPSKPSAKLKLFIAPTERKSVIITKIGVETKISLPDKGR